MSRGRSSTILKKYRFNPRPPKRTLCQKQTTWTKLHSTFQSTSSEEDVVSITIRTNMCKTFCFNPRPPKRTLCLENGTKVKICLEFQSTSSEEDVVSTKPGVTSCNEAVSIHVLRRGRCVCREVFGRRVPSLFQSTSSEEDVVSDPSCCIRPEW